MNINEYKKGGRMWEQHCFFICTGRVCWAYTLCWPELHLGAVQHNHTVLFQADGGRWGKKASLHSAAHISVTDWTGSFLTVWYTTPPPKKKNKNTPQDIAQEQSQLVDYMMKKAESRFLQTKQGLFFLLFTGRTNLICVYLDLNHRSKVNMFSECEILNNNFPLL